MAFTFVQWKSSTNSTSVTLDGSTIAGNLLVLCATFQIQNASVTIDSATLGGSADNFAKAADNVWYNSPWSVGAYVFADPGCAGGQTVISVAGTNLGSSPFQFGGLLAMEFTPGTLDQVQGASPSGGLTTWTTGQTPATAAADELYAGCFNIWNTLTGASADSTWKVQSGIGSQMIAGYKISTDPAGSTPQFSGVQETQPSNGSAVIATFKPSGPAAPVPGKVTLSQDIVYSVDLSQSVGTVTLRQQVIGSVTLSQEIVNG